MGLLALATEVQQEIIDYADNIKSIRQVCRQLADSADRAFLAKYFTERDHLMTEFGLRALKDIVSNPRLRKNLEKITLWAIDLNRPSWLKESEHPPARVGSASNVPPWSGSIKPTATFPQRLATAWRRWCSGPASFKGSAEESELLSKIFDALGKCGNDVAIAFKVRHEWFDEPECSAPPLGLRHLERRLELNLTGREPGSRLLRKMLSMQPKSYDGAAQTLLGAINDTAYPLTALMIQTRAVTPRLLGSSSTTSDQQRARGMSRALQSLQSLTLRHKWSIGYHHIVEAVEEGEWFENARLLLASATSLKHLDADLGYDVWTPVSDRLTIASFMNLAAMSLETIVLRGADTTAEELLSFLEKHNGSLKSLKLSHIQLEGLQSWEYIIGAVARAFQLEEVDLRYMLHGNDVLSESAGDSDVPARVTVCGSSRAVSAEMMQIASQGFHRKDWYEW
ncbi:hypothetical protein Slin14017_G101990 [Septoria linicola]|nr:hypothetical protein Slin14017_G101990 [Septoria linicola]